MLLSEVSYSYYISSLHKPKEPKMIHSIRTQLEKLQNGEAPSLELIEVLENVQDETRYLGLIVDGPVERWVNRDMNSAHFYAGKAIYQARNYIRNETVLTTATEDTMKSIHNNVLHAVEKVEGYLS